MMIRGDQVKWILKDRENLSFNRVGFINSDHRENQWTYHAMAFS